MQVYCESKKLETQELKWKKRKECIVEGDCEADAVNGTVEGYSEKSNTDHTRIKFV